MHTITLSKLLTEMGNLFLIIFTFLLVVFAKQTNDLFASSITDQMPYSVFDVVENFGVIGLLVLAGWYLYRERNKLETRLIELHRVNISEKIASIDEKKEEIRQMREVHAKQLEEMSKQLREKDKHITDLIVKVTGNG